MLNKNAFICLPFLLHFAFGLLFLFSNKKSFHYFFSICASTLSFACVFIIAKHFRQDFWQLHLINLTDILTLNFNIDYIGIVFALLCSFLSIPASIYAVSYMHQNNEKNLPRFFCYFHLSIGITIALAFSGNLITLFVCYELLTLLTYPLVTHNKNNNSQQAGKIYLGYLMLTSIALFFPAILIVFNLSGTMEFNNDLAIDQFSWFYSCLLFLLFAFGISKAAIMPVHKWLPAAMVAPTPVSSLLHAVAVVKSGVFSIIKIAVYVFGAGNSTASSGNIVLYIAGITVITASLIALQKKHLKEILAYSTISQLSYIIMTACIFTKSAISAALIYMVAHGFGKITLFFTSGAIYTAAKRTKIEELNGIGKNMPITMAAFCIGALAMIGLPPTAAFIGKSYIFSSAFAAQNYFVVFVLFISTILNSLYFLPIVLNAFFINPNFSCKEADFSMLLPYIITGLGIILGFFFFNQLLMLLHITIS